MADLPSFREWKRLLNKTSGANVDIHHGVEEYIQRFLDVDTSKMVTHNGISIPLGETVTGVPLPRNKGALDDFNDHLDDADKLNAIHKGKDNGGISGILQNRIPTSRRNPVTGELFDPQDIVRELRKIHVQDYPQFANLWPAMRDHFRKLIADGEMDPLIIPD